MSKLAEFRTFKGTQKKPNYVKQVESLKKQEQVQGLQKRKEQEQTVLNAPLVTKLPTTPIAQKPILAPVLPTVTAKANQEQGLKTLATQKKAELNQITPQAQRELENKKTNKQIKSDIKDKYGVDVKNAVSPVDFVNKLNKYTKGMSGEERSAFEKDYRQYIIAESSTDKFGEGSRASFSVLPTAFESIGKGTQELKETQDSIPYILGKGISDVGKFGLAYSGVSNLFPAVGGAKTTAEAFGTLTPNIGQAVASKFGQGALGTVTTELAKDITLGTAIGGLDALGQGQRGEELAETIAQNILFDIGVNVGGGIVGTLGKAVKNTKTFKNISEAIQQAKASKTPQMVEEVAKSMDITPEQASDIIDSKIDFYINQYGVASKEPFEQLQLEAPKPQDPGIFSDNLSSRLRAVEQPQYKGADFKGKYSLTDRKYPTTDIGNRKVNAFQYDNPEVQPYFREKASELLDDATYAKRGGYKDGKILKDEFGEVVNREGNFRATTPQMARIRDETGYGYEDIKKALRDIIEDNGKENHALAKKIETVIDDMLVEGYVNIVGENIKPNIRYIQMRNRLDPTKIKIPELEGANPSQLNQQMIMGIDQQKSMFESDDAFDDFLDYDTTPKGQKYVPKAKQEIKPKLDRPSEFTVRQPQYPPLAKDFTTERPFTVTPSEVSKLEQFKQFKAQNPVEVRQSAMQVEQPQVSMRVESTPKQVTTKEPVDTLKMVMTDIPSVRKGTLGEGLERFYQETVSKVAPFETLAKKTDTPLLRASATNLNRTTGTVDYNISKAQSDMDGNQIGDSIMNIFKQVDNNTKPQFYDYVLNKHNVDRFAQGKPVFGDTVDSTVSAQKIAEYEAKYPQFKEQQQKVTQYFNNLMNEWGVKSGLVSEDTAKMLRDMYPNYVPTYRSQEIAKAMGGDGNFVSNILKKAKGSEKNILPLDQQMAILTDRTIRNARKNEVMTILDDVYQANPEIASKYISNVKKVGEKKVVSDILDVGKEIEAPVVREGDKYLVNFYRNGEPHQMTINKTLYEAIRAMEQDGLDKGLNVVRKYATNPFKSLITQKNPIFFVRNVMRDIPTALIYSNDSLGLVKNTPEAIKEMLTNGKLWNQYQAMGGTRSGLFNYEKGVKIDFAGNKKSLPKKILAGTGDALEMVNNMTETLPRFAEYVTSIKKGEPPMLALMRSAEITTDFSRFGKQTKRADAVVPYLNASVQGLDKFFRQMRDKPLQTMAKGGLVVSVPALILDQVNKDNEAYNEMTSRERNNYYHIPKGDGTFYRIPRSREVGVLFGTMLEWASRNARGQEVTGDEIIETLKSNFTPVNGFDSNIIKPAINFVNIATGKNTDAKNFFGSNIVPESLQRYSPGQQFTEKTTSLSKALGQYLDVPPVAIDYLIDSYLGVIADVGMPLLTDNKSKALSPFENAFIADPVFKSASVDKFYSNLNKLNKLSADTNRNYGIDSKLVTPYEEERNKLNKLAKQLSDLRKQQTEAQKGKDEEKVRELRIEMNQLSKDAVSSLKTEEELKALFEKFLRERQVK